MSWTRIRCELVRLSVLDEHGQDHVYRIGSAVPDPTKMGASS